MFLLSIFLAPVFCAIPSFATAPALIFVGFLMVGAVTEIDFDDLTEAVPAYLCLVAMPLQYSISEGISFGVISYVVIKSKSSGLNPAHFKRLRVAIFGKNGFVAATMV